MNGSQYRDQPRKSPIPSTSHFYPFADGGVLFFEGTRRIWALNSSSAYIWCMLEETRNIGELAKSMARRFSIDLDTALRDVKNTLALFEREGLLGDGWRCDPPEDDDRWDITPYGPTFEEPERWAIRQSFETPNHVFEFCCTDYRLGEAFAENMCHLALNREKAPHTGLAVLPGDETVDTWDVYLNGRRYVGGISRNEVLPYLSTLIFVRSCEALHDRLLFHAAVLGREGKVVLFPAEAGSGKTTLAATLAARGFRYLSDELAVLDVNSLRVSPFPLPMSIKPGSIDVLERHYPDLARRSVHHRSDGKLVRYLSPSEGSLADPKMKNAQIHSLVFPQYREGAKTRLAALEKAVALRRLARTGSSNREFRAADVKAMIEVVEQNSCYELIFSDLGEAVSLLEREVFDGV